MKFIHLADLHIGKRLKERSLLPDQRYALEFVLDYARAMRPDAVLIAGDVYDKAVPSGDAVSLLSWFLTGLHQIGCTVCIIGGNHDSQERLSFAGQILMGSGLYISDIYNGEMHKVCVADAYGEVDIYLLPHILPREVARFFEGQTIDSVEDAVRAALDKQPPDRSRRSILMTHQFVTATGEAPLISDSEINPIGGLSAVDFSAFDAFCYVALGHLHGAQRIGRDTVRYAGSPVRYSFSETRQIKSFVSGEIGMHGEVCFELIPIPQLHGMRELEGEIARLLSPENVRDGNCDDYLRVTLTDTPPPVAPMERLAAAYPNVLSLELKLKGGEALSLPSASAKEKDPLELFADFYLMMTGRAISGPMCDYVQDAMNRLFREGGVE